MTQHCAATEYRDATGQHARVVVYRGMAGWQVCAYLNDEIAPRWHERDLDRRNAECWGQIYGRRLVDDYHMTRGA